MSGPSPDRIDALRSRARIVQAIRAFFIGGGFLEVETPVLIPAPAPEAHIDAPSAEGGFLQTSPELAMKRLLAAGSGKIFQLCRCFRAGERGSRHLPEFTMLEWYRPGADYTALMEECANLLAHVASSTGHRGVVERGGVECRLDRGVEVITVDEAYLRYAGVTAAEAVAADEFDRLMVDRIEPHLGVGRPTVLKDYPASQAALARLKEEDPTVAERFELYVAGIELANGFSELIDPEEQRARFLAESRAREAACRTVYPMAEKFLNDLEKMPPSAGIALGVDRLVMLLTGADSIDRVVAFTPEEL